MRLNDYLASFGEDDAVRQAYIDAVNAVGSRTVDLFDDDPPAEFDPEKDPLDVDAIHAIVTVPNGDGTFHTHVLLLDYQYAWWVEQRPKPKWIKAASKAAKKFFKATVKDGGAVEDGPRHVFGSSIFDPDEREIVYPGKKPKKKIDE